MSVTHCCHVQTMISSKDMDTVPVRLSSRRALLYRDSGSSLQAVLQAVAGLSNVAHRRAPATSQTDASAAILAAVRRLALASPAATMQRSSRDQALAGRLQPSLRRALRVVAHPEAFNNGYMPEELQATPGTKVKRRKGRRRRRKRKVAVTAGIAGLEQRATDDALLHEALSEYKWRASLARHAAKDPAIMPGQRVRAYSVPAEPVGRIQREAAIEETAA